MPLDETTSNVLLFIMALGGTVLLELIGLRFFSWFVSHERKEGHYRAEDLSSVKPASTKLPALGGVAALLAISTALIVSTLLGFTDTNFRWFLLPVWSFGLIGFLDDLRKHRGQGQDERTRLVLIFIGSVIVAYVLYARMGFSVAFAPYTAISYARVPIIWAIFWFVMASSLTTVTTLSVGFTDGIDGLLGGLWLIAAAAYAIFTTLHEAAIASDISIALAGGALGFLLLNLPSRWSAGQPSGQRRARVYLGETGALMVGGAFSMLALLSQTEFIWFIVGGVFALEGGSAFYQAKIATRVFRRYLILAAHRDRRMDVPHTEFPLPFLATPLHAHFDLLGVSRYRIVQILWVLGAAFAAIGLWAAFANELFVKVIAWLVGVALMLVVWRWGNWTRYVFIGFHPEENGRDRVLAIYRGKPLEFFGQKLYWLEERLAIREAEAQRFGLLTNLVMFRPMTMDEARIALGYVYYRLARYPEALATWRLVRPKSIAIRADIQAFYDDVQRRVPAPVPAPSDSQPLPQAALADAGSPLMEAARG
jgi:UDP-N-acetylmuramyl pentapeptide phosphotransferase/UDP-N-acetylglucosamine-1-phosphate transferase